MLCRLRKGEEEEAWKLLPCGNGSWFTVLGGWLPSNKIEWFPCSVKIFLALFGPLVRRGWDVLGLFVDVVVVGVVGENGIDDGPASAIWGSSYSSAAPVSMGLLMVMVLNGRVNLPAGGRGALELIFRCRRSVRRDQDGDVALKLIKRPVACGRASLFSSRVDGPS